MVRLGWITGWHPPENDLLPGDIGHKSLSRPHRSLLVWWDTRRCTDFLTDKTPAPHSLRGGRGNRKRHFALHRGRRNFSRWIPPHWKGGIRADQRAAQTWRRRTAHRTRSATPNRAAVDALSGTVTLSRKVLVAPVP